MSPTMTEGGIAGWKKKEGEAFTTGDVLLEIVRSIEFNPQRTWGSVHDIVRKDRCEGTEEGGNYVMMKEIDRELTVAGNR